MPNDAGFLLKGLDKKRKAFLYQYAQKELGHKSRTKAILSLIDAKMAEAPKQFFEKPSQTSPKNKKRVQLSLQENDHINLLSAAQKNDESIQHYIIRLIIKDLYNVENLNGVEMEVLRKSNYELHKIGVNLNQIARALNAGEQLKHDLGMVVTLIKNHVGQVQNLLADNLVRY